MYTPKLELSSEALWAILGLKGDKAPSEKRIPRFRGVSVRPGPADLEREAEATRRVRGTVARGRALEYVARTSVVRIFRQVGRS